MPQDIGPSDRLRRFEDLANPDRRQLAYRIADEGGGFRNITHRDRYDSIAKLELAPEVPAEVIHFDTARHLMVYSWYVYRFGQVAEMHALASLEMALNLRFPQPEKGKPPTLAVLLRRALDKGNLTDRDVERLRIGAEGVDPVLVGASGAGLLPSAPADPADPTRFVRTLVRSLPKYRNELAHGSSMLAPTGVAVLSICRRLIDLLFSTATDGPNRNRGGASEP